MNYQLVDPQRFWTSAEVYVYHLSKLLPALMLWGACLWTLTVGARARSRAPQRDPAMAPLRQASGRRRTSML